MTELSEDATYDAYLLRYPDGTWMAQLTDLPGAYATGSSQEEALARLAAAIPAYYAWLSQHDEYTPITHEAPRVVARESAQVGEGPAQGLGAFFSGDAQPVTDEDLDWWLAALDWAYGDLLGQARRLPASAQRDAMLDAIAQAQTRLVSLATGARAGAQTGAAPGADPLARLEMARAASFAAFRGSSAEMRASVREEAGQRWSVRRGLRESALLARRATDGLATAQG
ncbi:MAG TPA: hypothetical protein VF812_19360 [Ktedonobacterales bacterium]